MIYTRGRDLLPEVYSVCTINRVLFIFFSGGGARGFPHVEKNDPPQNDFLNF